MNDNESLLRVEDKRMRPVILAFIALEITMLYQTTYSNIGTTKEIADAIDIIQIGMKTRKTQFD